MRINNLADVCRRAGLAVEEVPGWKTRGREMAGLRGVVWHHTNTPRSSKSDYPTRNVIINGRTDLPGPLSQLGLGYSGMVYVFASGRCNHAGAGSWSGVPANDGNGYCLGVEMESPGDGTWTRAQLDAMPVLRDALSAAYNIPAGMHFAHREWAPRRRNDPVGINIRTMASSSGVLGRGSIGPAVVALQERLNMFGAGLAVDGDYGHATEAIVKLIQTAYGLPPDGTIGQKTKKIIMEDTVLTKDQDDRLKRLEEKSQWLNVRIGGIAQWIGAGNYNETEPGGLVDALAEAIADAIAEHLTTVPDDGETPA